MKYENWRELAAECQKSGMPVSAWSKKKNIPGTTCRQWLNKLNKEKGVLSLEEGITQDSDLPIWGKIDLKESIQKESIQKESIQKESIQKEPMVSASACKNNICLKYHDWSIELNSNFNPSLLKQIIKVVESVC